MHKVRTNEWIYVVKNSINVILLKNKIKKKKNNSRIVLKMKQFGWEKCRRKEHWNDVETTTNFVFHRHKKSC